MAGKSLLALVLLLAVAGALAAEMQTHWAIKEAARINSIQGGSWKARAHPRFAGSASSDQAARTLIAYLGQPEDVYARSARYPKSAIIERPKSIPAAFDARTQWPGCVHPVLDQGNCGSCWSFGASEALSDRFCIQSNKTITAALSPQPLISCDHWLDFACNGGMPLTAWWWMERYGLSTLDCWPYQSYNGSVPKCRNTCVNGEPYKQYKVKSGSTAVHIGSQSMQTALMRGPIEVAFAVFEDFMLYESGVYTRKSDKFLGLHAVKMIGWGHDSASNMDYWICQNSWGTDWGENGFFRINRGHNECLIETASVSGDAHL